MADSPTLARLRSALDKLDAELNDPQTGIDAKIRAAIEAAEGDEGAPAVKALVNRKEKLTDDFRVIANNLATLERQQAADDKKTAEDKARKDKATAYMATRGNSPAKDASQYLDDLEAAEALGQLTPQQVRQRWEQYQYEHQTKPANERAEQRAVEAATRAQSSTDLALRNESRGITRDEQQTGLDRAKYGRDAAKDAVDRATRQAEITRSRVYAEARGRGASIQEASRESWEKSTQIDLDDIADRAAQRALSDLLRGGGSAAGGAGPSVATPPTRVTPGPAQAATLAQDPPNPALVPPPASQPVPQPIAQPLPAQIAPEEQDRALGKLRRVA